MNTASTTELAEVAKAEVGALAIITLDPARYVAEVYAPYRAKLATLIAADEGVVVDAKTTAGMDMAIKRRAGYRDDVRIASQKSRVERKAPMLTIGKLLDSEYKALAADAAPHEEKWDKIIKTEEARKEAEKAAKIAAERARVEAIQREIQGIRDAALDAAGKSAEVISSAIQIMERVAVTEAEFSEFAGEAQVAVDATITKLREMHAAALAAEQAARDAEAARLAEIERQRIAAAEVERQRVENARIAEELRAETRRLADITAKQKAEQVERERVAAEVQAAAQRAIDERAKAAADELARQQAELAAERQSLADQKAAADARDRQAVIECLMPEAAAMNAQFDSERLERDHTEALEIDAHLSDLAAPRDHAEAVIAVTSLYDAAPVEPAYAIYGGNDDDELTDEEIIDFGKECGLDLPVLVERLGRFVAEHCGVAA